MAGYILRWFTCSQTVTHPSTNRAWRRVTSLIETNVSALGQATTCKRYPDSRTLEMGQTTTHQENAVKNQKHLHRRNQPSGTLDIWLDQKPVHHCCPVEDGPQSASGQIPPPHRTTTVSSVSTLGGATTRRHSIFFFAVRQTRRHVPQQTTSTQLILDAWGPFCSRSGP